MKARFLGLAFVSVGIVASAVFVAAGSLGNPETYGPYSCGAHACYLRTPMPDVGTAAFIAHYDNEINGPKLFAPGRNTRVADDRFVVCGPTHCVTYKRTHSGGFLGGPPAAITQHGYGGVTPPVGAGGDGAMLGAGGGNGGGCSACNRNPDRWGEVGDIEDALTP